MTNCAENQTRRIRMRNKTGTEKRMKRKIVPENCLSPYCYMYKKVEGSIIMYD